MLRKETEQMKLMLKYFKRYWIFAVMAPLMMLLEVFMDLMLPAIMARIIDEGIAQKDLQLVLRLGIYMFIATILALIGGAACTTLSSMASTGLGADLRKDLFSKILSLSHKNLDQLESGNLITRLTNDVSQMEEVSRMILRIRAPLLIIGSLTMAITISRQLSILLVLFVPLLVITLFIIIRKAYPLFYRVQKYIDKLNTRIQENLSGKRMIKAFVREDFEEEKFQRSNAELTDTTILANRVIAFMNPAMQLLLNGGIITALWYGSKLVDIGVLKIGVLIAFINYLRQLLFSLMMFSNLVMRYSRAQASSVRIQKILDTEPDLMEDSNGKAIESGEGKIEFRNVSFSYGQTNDPVLKRISFSINPGETLAVIGATGSGKSSLAGLIPRFYDIESGEILIDDINIKTLNLESLRKKIAFVSQQPLLFSGSVRRNILFHYDDWQRDELIPLMEEAASTADIMTFLTDLPSQFNTEINQKGVNLSGGQKQRVAIARALAKKAPILILDDATSAVDMVTEGKIYGSLKKQNHRQTVLIIAQRISSIMDADKIMVLDDGEISGLGSHKELLRDNTIYQEIYYSQVDKEAAS